MCPQLPRLLGGFHAPSTQASTTILPPTGVGECTSSVRVMGRAHGDNTHASTKRLDTDRHRTSGTVVRSFGRSFGLATRDQSSCLAHGSPDGWNANTSLRLDQRDQGAISSIATESASRPSDTSQVDSQ